MFHHCTMKSFNLFCVTLILLIYTCKAQDQQCSNPNELWVECGESCNRDLCTVPRYLVACVSQCAPGCYCECGYLRNIDGICEPTSKCKSNENLGYDSWCPKPKPDCPNVCASPNEVFKDCASFCGGTCRDYRLPRFILCINGCKVGCVCADGFARHPITDECIPINDCPTTDVFDYENNVPIGPKNCTTKRRPKKCRKVIQIRF